MDGKEVAHMIGDLCLGLDALQGPSSCALLGAEITPLTPALRSCMPHCACADSRNTTVSSGYRAAIAPTDTSDSHC